MVVRVADLLAAIGGIGLARNKESGQVWFAIYAMERRNRQ
jgi:hypothetical protein